jgi:hypothetical protein
LSRVAGYKTISVGQLTVPLRGIGIPEYKKAKAHALRERLTFSLHPFKNYQFSVIEQLNANMFCFLFVT